MTGLIPESFYPPNTAAKVLKKWQWDKYYFSVLFVSFLAHLMLYPQFILFLLVY